MIKKIYWKGSTIAVVASADERPGLRYFRAEKQI